MRLRRQLILVSLLTLSLPWAGCQYIQEMEAALRHGQILALDATAQAVAQRVSSEPGLLERLQSPRWQQPASEQLYLHPVTTPLLLDGYDDDWRSLALQGVEYRSDVNSSVGNHPADEPSAGVTSSETPAAPVGMELTLARQGDFLWLFAWVEDAQIRYHNPSTGLLGSGDHLLLRTAKASMVEGWQDYVVRSGAPGEVSVVYRDRQQRERQEHRIQGVWQEHAQGFQLELRLPLSLVGDRLGVALMDAVDLPPVPVVNEWTLRELAQRPTHRGLGNIQPDVAAPYWVSLDDELNRTVAVFSRQGLKLQLASSNQWLLADAGVLQTSAIRPEQQPHGLLSWLYRLALGSKSFPVLEADTATGRVLAAESLLVQIDDPAAVVGGWYQWGRKRVGRVAEAIRDEQGQPVAAVVVEQSSDNLMALTNTAFNRLFFYTLLATAVAGAGLLAYASWLSLRIRRLSLAATEAIDDSGRIQDSFPESRAVDEVGDLTRNYAQLLTRLREYTDYLRTLSSKLSHELRTPLAVVRSSLDNLEHEPLSDSARTYARRAQDGSARLSHILTAMSSATRVEEAIRQAELERFPLAELIKSVGAAYGDVLPAGQLQVQVDASAEDCLLLGAPDLLVQMLDKLVENAADFCPPGGTIRLGLRAAEQHWLLQVANDGPLLPGRMQGQLFDSLVSVRDASNRDATHLGLGLHIVRLIVEFHGGEVVARNREDLSGVVFEVRLPKPAAAP